LIGTGLSLGRSASTATGNQWEVQEKGFCSDKAGEVEGAAAADDDDVALFTLPEPAAGARCRRPPPEPSAGAEARRDITNRADGALSVVVVIVVADERPPRRGGALAPRHEGMAREEVSFVCGFPLESASAGERERERE